MCLDATTAVGCHVVGKYRVHQQWCMAEQVVEQIWLGDVIELIGTANPPGHREAAVGQMLEKGQFGERSEEHTSELQSLMRISYAVFCLKKKKTKQNDTSTEQHST